MEEFVTFIRSIVGIHDSDLQLVLSKCVKRSVPRGQLILRKGQVASKYFFIVSAGIRFFYDQNAQEMTTWISMADDILALVQELGFDKVHIMGHDIGGMVAAYNDADSIRASNGWYQTFGQDIEDAKSYLELNISFLAD